MLAKIKYLTSGESHGQGLLGILDGIPAGLEISQSEIREQLSRRQMGYGRGGRMKIETDFAEIWGGVRHGKTLGSPIGLILKNKDWGNWTNKMSVEPNDQPGKKVTLLNEENELLSSVIFSNKGQDYSHNFYRTIGKDEVYRTMENVFYMINVRPTYWGSKPSPKQVDNPNQSAPSLNLDTDE